MSKSFQILGDIQRNIQGKDKDRGQIKSIY